MALVRPILAVFDCAWLFTITQFLASALSPLLFTRSLLAFAFIRLEAHDVHSLALLLDPVDIHRSIVASRSGPTPTLIIGNPSKFSIFST